MLPDDFQHPPFEKSDRELAINALCDAVRDADTEDKRRSAAEALLNYIEGPNRGA